MSKTWPSGAPSRPPNLALHLTHLSQSWRGGMQTEPIFVNNTKPSSGFNLVQKNKASKCFKCNIYSVSFKLSLLYLDDMRLKWEKIPWAWIHSFMEHWWPVRWKSGDAVKYQLGCTWWVIPTRQPGCLLSTLGKSTRHGREDGVEREFCELPEATFLFFPCESFCLPKWYNCRICRVWVLYMFVFSLSLRCCGSLLNLTLCVVVFVDLTTESFVPWWWKRRDRQHTARPHFPPPRVWCRYTQLLWSTYSLHAAKWCSDSGAPACVCLLSSCSKK